MSKTFNLITKGKNIIFCQAMADIAYALQIIKLAGEQNCVIYVTNVEYIYIYLKELCLNVVDIIYIFPLKLNMAVPRSILKAKKDINDIWKKYFDTYTECKIYFFSTSYDYMTASIVKRLSQNKTNKVYYHNYYDTLTSSLKPNGFSVKRYIFSYIFRYITGVQFIHNVRTNFPKFDISKYQIEELTVTKKTEIEERYLYKVQDAERYNILLFISPHEYDSLTEESRIVLINWLDAVKSKGYKIYLKGHPRLGEPEGILARTDETIPLYIPGEFIDYKFFSYVVGISSAALCYPAQRKIATVISLLNVLELKDSKMNEKLKKYIMSYSGNTILFDISRINMNILVE